MQPLVSVVICTRNRKDSLQNYALPSLTTVKYPNFEVIVVDDGSSDGTDQFLRTYCQTHNHIRVVRNPTSGGLCKARNVGIQHCRGDVIAFIDDDCAVTADWMQELVNAYAQPTIAVVGGVSYRGDSEEIYINDKHAWGCNMSFRASIFKR